MLIALVFFCTENKKANSQDVVITREVGNVDNTILNITYCGKENPFEDMLSYSIVDSNVKNIDTHNVRCTSGFANVVPIENYIANNDMTTSDFCQKYGVLYMSLYHDEKNYYLCQNIFSNPNCWNLLVEENGTWNFIKLCDMEDETEESFRFALKMQFEGKKLYIYLDSGLCIVDSNYEVSIQKWNINKLFWEICNQDIRPHNTKVQYIDGYLYFLASSNKYKDYFVIKYNISKEEIQKYKTNYSAQEILNVNNNIVILSINENKVFLEKFYNNSIEYQEISEITDLKLENFKKNTPLTKIINYGEGFYLTLTNADDSNPKNYIFNINYKDLELLGFEEVVLKNRNYNLYGISFYTT